MLQHPIQELAGLIGVPIGEQLHRALQIGEEHGDLLALAFQDGFGGENLLREIGGGVAAGGVRVSCQ
jgi:hypothetical protein